VDLAFEPKMDPKIRRDERTHASFTKSAGKIIGAVNHDVVVFEDSGARVAVSAVSRSIRGKVDVHMLSAAESSFLRPSLSFVASLALPCRLVKVQFTT